MKILLSYIAQNNLEINASDKLFSSSKAVRVWYLFYVRKLLSQNETPLPNIILIARRMRMEVPHDVMSGVKAEILKFK